MHGGLAERHQAEDVGRGIFYFVGRLPGELEIEHRRALAAGGEAHAFHLAPRHQHVAPATIAEALAVQRHLDRGVEGAARDEDAEPQAGGAEQRDPQHMPAIRARSHALQRAEAENAADQERPERGQDLSRRAVAEFERGGHRLRAHRPALSSVQIQPMKVSTRNG